ncbi:MAG: glycosyltransferase family 2 protein [Candidatus Falkowbacteria bacterium]|nr:MAG: glycosyltransferase family 2 protein [Candidatus Falkowbacteria bacterium]
MKFSLVIINYKTFDLTKACLESLFLLPNQNNLEIILIDNASNDGSIEKLETEFGPKVKIIKNKQNLGFAGANNQGAAIASGEFLIFLNSDTIIKEDFLNTCADILNNNPKIGIISPRLKLPDGEDQKAAFGIFPTWVNLLTQKTKNEAQLDKHNDFLISDWVSGCALMISQKLFQEIGGWDDHFFLYYEDIDICKKASLKGYQSAVALKTNIIHFGGQSLKASSEKKKRYYESQDYYFKKYYSSLTGLLIKIMRFIYLKIKK